MSNEYKRGGIYLAELDGGVGSEQAGRRPVIIIQNDIGNKYSPTLIVAALTSDTNVKTLLPTHYYMGSTRGLYKDSVVLLEQIRTIDKSRIIHYIGHANWYQMKEIDKALGISVGLESTSHMTLCPVCARKLHSSGAFVIKKTSRAVKKKSCRVCKAEKARNYEVSFIR